MTDSEMALLAVALRSYWLRDRGIGHLQRSPQATQWRRRSRKTVEPISRDAM
ncbi:MAG: hypothetical protein ACJAXA_003242 [Candidatus Aldehydirespiratoraceae bacterium]|jgi:hypothetical protein